MADSLQYLAAGEWPEAASSIQQHVNGVTLHEMELGEQDAPLVILLHGFADFWWGWRRQVGPLAAAGFRVVAPDQRGYNLSEKPIGLKAYDLDTLAADIVGLADVYGRSKFFIIGHDFGGLVAWWTASRYPDRVARFVSINSFHPQILLPFLRRNPRQMLRSIYMAIFQFSWVPEAMLRAGNFAIMRQLFVRSSKPGTFSKADMDYYQTTWSKPGALTGMINWYRALRYKPEIENLRVKVPALVIWGNKDVYLERGLAEESLALCDRGQALWVENGTHFVHIEEPELVNRALVDFLKS
jgi:pimeloyl-ACP methyl ester carboxylesterase